MLYFLTKNDNSTISVSNGTRSILKDFLLAQKIEFLSVRPPPSYIPGSCADIKDHCPHSPSGYYTITTSNGDSTTVYCHMEELCKSEGPCLSCDSSFIQDCYCFSLVYSEFAMICYPEHYKQSFNKYKLE